MTSFCRLVFPVALFMLMANPVFAQDQAPLQDLVGIPVMEGLEENLDARIVFDKAEGRIIHAVLTGDKTRAEVEAFYQETLYQLGWAEAIVEAGVLVFARDDERLTLAINDSDPLEIEIDLAPIS